MTTPTPRATPCLLPPACYQRPLSDNLSSEVLLAAVCGQLWAAQCAISISTPPQHWAGADVVWCWWKDGTFWLFITRLVVWNEPMSERVFWQWHVSSMMEAGKGNYRQGILTQVEWLVIFYHRLRVFPCDIHFCMKIEKTCWKEAFDITQMPSDIRRLTSALVSNPLDDLCIDIWMFVMIISEPRLQRDRILYIQKCTTSAPS